MARLRVGDVEIDGSNITIGGVPQITTTVTRPAGGGGPQVVVTTTTPATASTAIVTTAPAVLAVPPRPTPPASSASSTSGLDGLAAIPVSERALVGGGAALAIGAGVALGLTGAGGLVPLLFTGVGAIVLGVMKRWAVNRRTAARARGRDRELSLHADRLRPLLVGASTDQTVEWLVEKSGLPEASVVRTLALMRARHEVSEELNVDTGEWYYSSASALPVLPRDLDDRLAALEQDGSEAPEEREP